MAQARRQKSSLSRLGLPIAAGFFLIVYAVLGWSYFVEQGTQDELKKEIASKNAELLIPVRIDDQLQAAFDAVNEQIPVGLTAEDVQLAVIDLAEKQGFNVNPATTGLVIAAGEAGSATVEGIDYRVLPFSVSGVGGDIDRVKSFISSLYTEQGLETLVLDSVSISRSEDQANASIKFHVYTRP